MTVEQNAKYKGPEREGTREADKPHLQTRQILPPPVVRLPSYFVNQPQES